MNARPEPTHMIQVNSLHDNVRDLAYHLDRLGKYAHSAANNPRLESQISLWCEALESGTYEQTTEVLYDGRAYCAVGVYASACLGLPSEDIEGIAVLTDIYELDLGLPAGISQCEITALNDLEGRYQPAAVGSIRDWSKKDATYIKTVLDFPDIAAVLRWACKMGPPFIFKVTGPLFTHDLHCVGVTRMSVHDFIVKYHPLPESAHVNKQAVG